MSLRVAQRMADVSALQGLVGNRATNLAMQPLQREVLQRDKANEQPLADIQGKPMFALLPVIAAMQPVAARADYGAAMVVGGPRLVVAMKAAASVGDWKGFAAANAEELANLPPDQIGDIMRYVKAPADVKQYERNEFDGRYDAWVEPTSGLITLIMKVKIEPVEDAGPSRDEIAQFRSEFKQNVESTWSGKGTVKPSCPDLPIAAFKTKVVVHFVDGGEHLPITLYSSRVNTGAIETDKQGRRRARLSADAARERPTEHYAGQPKDSQGRPIPLKSKQSVAAHEFGHAIGIDHPRCKGGGVCYGSTQQEWDDVMGGGMKLQVLKDAKGLVTHSDFAAFERIGERWGRDVFPGGLAAKCNKWTAV